MRVGGARDLGQSRPCADNGGEAARGVMTAETRASGSIGKVTIEISQRSICSMRRTPRGRVAAGANGLEADREPVDGAGAHEGEDLAGAGHAGHQPAA